MAHNNTRNDYLVVFSGEDTAAGAFDVFVQQLDDDGTELGTNDLKVGTVPGVTFDTGIACNSVDDEYLVIFEGEGLAAGGDQDIFGQLLSHNASGHVIQAAPNDFRISDMGPNGVSTAEVAFGPTVAHNSLANEYLACWQGIDNRAPFSGDQEIFCQLLDGNASAIEENDFRLSNAGGNGAGFAVQGPAVAYNGTSLNSHLVVWTGTDNKDSQIAGESEVRGHVVEPVLEVSKTITTNTTGVDAFDTVQYEILVEHKQDLDAALTHDVSLRNAFNVTLSDPLPAALTSPTIVSATTSNDGFSTTTDVSSQFEIATGVLQTTGAANIDLPHDTVDGTTHTALKVVVEGTVANTVQPGDTTTANTATIGWTNHNPGLVHPEYNDSSTTPSIAVPASFSVSKAADVANVTIGDTITYEATVTVIEGTTNNLQFVDTLPLGTTYVAASAGVSSANGMTISPLMVTGPVGQVGCAT